MGFSGTWQGQACGLLSHAGLSWRLLEIKLHLPKFCTSHPCLKPSQAGLYTTVLTVFTHIFKVGVKLGGVNGNHQSLWDAPSHLFMIFLVTLSQWVSDDPMGPVALYIILYIYFERQYV